MVHSARQEPLVQLEREETSVDSVEKAVKHVNTVVHSTDPPVKLPTNISHYPLGFTVQNWNLFK